MFGYELKPNEFGVSTIGELADLCSVTVEWHDGALRPLLNLDTGFEHFGDLAIPKKSNRPTLLMAIALKDHYS